MTWDGRPPGTGSAFAGDATGEPEPAARWILPIVGHTLGSTVAGGIVCGLILPSFVGVLPWFGEAGLPRWAWVLVGVLVGGAFGLRRGLRVVWRRRKAQQLAGQRSLRFSDHGDHETAERLKTILGREGFVSLENMLSGERAGLQMVFGDLVYVPLGSKESSRRVNTIAAFQRDELSFPRFTLRPEGGLLNVMAGFVGVEDIDFESHPEFSRCYHLSAQDPEAVRQLFQPRLLDFLDARPGWEIRGEKDRLVILKPGKVVEANRMDEFVDETLALFAEFETATRDGGRMIPPLSRPDHSPGSLVDWARNQATSPDQVESFIESPVPREVPRKILFQYLNGSVWFSGILLGLLACLGGCLVGVGAAVNEPTFLVVGVGLAVIALGLLAWIIHRRSRKYQLLTSGHLTQGQVERVEATQVTINGRQRYLAHVRYAVNGLSQRVTVPLYGGHVELARDASDQSRPIRLLYDPDASQRVVLDLQLVTQFPFRT